MQTDSVVSLIESFAPLELQSDWDCSGWIIKIQKNVKKILLTLSVTEDTIQQAQKLNCDMIISHHPLFFVPFSLYKNIPIYSAHTNLDKTVGGTTDKIASVLNLKNLKQSGEFLRLAELEKETNLNAFVETIKNKLQLKQLRVVNNLNLQRVKKIAICAGSGADLIYEAQEAGSDAFLTGDLKYHAALESKIILLDIGHFESERPILTTLEELLSKQNLEVIIADEKSPFIIY